MCHDFEKGLSHEKKQADKQCLREYLKTVFKPEKHSQINTIVTNFVTEVSYVKETFRNPSAHTRTLPIDKAEECMNKVVDIERLLIKILDTCVE